jgi:dipeptidase
MAATGAVTASGAVLFAKNSDREFDEAQHLELIPAATHARGARVRLTHVEIDQALRTHRVLLSRPHWIWGAEIGTNEHGLTIGNEAIFARTAEASLEPGIIGMDYLRLALERSRDVDEGIEIITSLLSRHGQSGNCGFRRSMAYHNSFLLADTKGAKVLETVDREWAITPITDYYAISNALTIESFRAIHEDPERKASGCHRRSRATELLSERAGALRASDFFRVLRDHKEGAPAQGRTTGPRICGHTPESALGTTTASWVASLEAGNVVHWVTGTSATCTGLFKPVILEIGLPAHGPRPGSARDAQSLWWRHEHLRQALDQADDETRGAFIAERDTLERQFLSAMGSCPRVTEERDLVAAVVARCWQEGLAFEDKWAARITEREWLLGA